MERNLVIIISIVALSVLIAPLGVLSVDPPLSCSAFIRCSNEPDNTYASDGIICKIYRNPCLLKSDNCDRVANNETVLVPTTKKECVPLCTSICPFYVSPICGEYKNKKRSFNNECEMDRDNCKNGETYLLFSQGPCECS